MSNLAIEGQHDGDYNGAAHGLPGGQGHNKPLLQVGTYERPLGNVDIAGIIGSDNDPGVDKPAPGTKGAYPSGPRLA